MYRPTGNPDRGGYRPPSREQLAAQQRKTLRRVGAGLIIGGAFLAGAGIFTAVDATNHGISQPTLVEHLLPQLPADAQFQWGYAGIAAGGVSVVSGIGLVFANQEPSRY